MIDVVDFRAARGIRHYVYFDTFVAGGFSALSRCNFILRYQREYFCLKNKKKIVLDVRKYSHFLAQDAPTEFFCNIKL